MVDEALDFYVKATGREGTQKRQELVNMRPGELRRNLEHWRLRAEEKQRLQEKKEEAWELFGRQPGHKQTTEEKFAQEFKRRVTNMMDGPRRQQGARKVLAGMDERAAKGSSGRGTEAGRQGDEKDGRRGCTLPQSPDP